MITNDPKKTHLARNLRQRQTDSEKLLWQKLRNRSFYGIKFRRQQPIGDFIVDFISFEIKLIIKLDGSQHIYKQVEYDKERSLVLEKMGFKVLRFFNNDVLLNLEGVLESIPHPIPLQAGEGTLERKSEV